MSTMIFYIIKLIRYCLGKPNSLHNKIMAGYQGWFGCPNDGSKLNTWFHWSTAIPIWPDVSEYTAEELFILDNKQVYSAYNELTVNRHFKWMKTYGLDGVFLQRFISETSSAPHLEFRNKVLDNVEKSAETYDRSFSIMYDISGQGGASLYDMLITDWESIRNVVDNSAYTHFNSKPLIAIWGFGFYENDCTPDIAEKIILYFKARGYAVMGGVPAYYRSLSRDCKPDVKWRKVFNLLDIVSPWTVGRYSDNKTSTSYKNFVQSLDIISTLWKGQEYMPVVFPGYCFPDKPSIPRNNGEFLEHQVKNLGASMLYIAMFDEVDEGTAIYKLRDITPTDLYLQKIKRLRDID